MLFRSLASRCLILFEEPRFEASLVDSGLKAVDLNRPRRFNSEMKLIEFPANWVFHAPIQRGILPLPLGRVHVRRLLQSLRTCFAPYPLQRSAQTSMFFCTLGSKPEALGQMSINLCSANMAQGALDNLHSEAPARFTRPCASSEATGLTGTSPAPSDIKLVVVALRDNGLATR